MKARADPGKRCCRQPLSSGPTVKPSHGGLFFVDQRWSAQKATSSAASNTRRYPISGLCFGKPVSIARGEQPTGEPNT